MIEIGFSPSFRRSFKKRIKGKSEVEKRFWECLNLFIHNPFDPKLKTHKIILE
jgi:mRNA-degrading endonuclease YafQ of YafQ-DinJ toxin-antitoxin module